MLLNALIHKLLKKRKYKPSDFKTEELIFRGFNSSDTCQENGKIEANSVRFPDFSCNWSRFSKPISVKNRKGGGKTDGCYAFDVVTSRYKEMATTCHDPIKNNYSHIEVRQLLPEEDIYSEPIKNRKLSKLVQGWSKSQRLEYRQNIVNNLQILIEPQK